MKRTLSLITLLPSLFQLFAASGGPDQYGYTWRDSNEPDGPIYEWIDITATGVPVTGLADDNSVGPLIMATNMPYYWYDQKKLWIASNGYVAFNEGNIAADFPGIPQAGGTENYIAGFMTDLTFAGVGNPGQCFVQDGSSLTVISYINVPFWSVTAPGYSGSNTFQIILNKADSTITFQYQSTTGLPSSNGPIVGIESLTGDIGLQSSSGILPTAEYAVRFYDPAVALLSITDASVTWTGEDGTLGRAIGLNTTEQLVARVGNTGNQDLPGFTVTSRILNSANTVLMTETADVGPLIPGQTADVALVDPFIPTVVGTYRHEITISGVADEFVSSNNVLSRELVVYDQSQLTTTVDWAGPSDDLIGIGWNGGNGGAGTYVLPPFHPCQVTGTTIRIVSNFASDFTMKVYDDDGPNGTPGTLLDSVYVASDEGQAGDHVYPTHAPIALTEGGYYVEWYMQGASVNIAQDVVPPFSLRSYEVLSGVWAPYRDRDIADWHLGLRIDQAPFSDAGCNGLLGINSGQTISAATQVTALIHNFGNMNLSNVPVHYQFNNGAVVSQNYSGPAITPGTSAVFNFSQLLQPSETVSGDLCVWSSYPTDTHTNNDTVCVAVDVVAGINELSFVHLSMAPNPVSDVLTVMGLPVGMVRYEVVDARGVRVLETSQERMHGPLSLDTRTLANGSYILRAWSTDSMALGRFTVQH